jgi:hypothetical protein
MLSYRLPSNSFNIYEHSYYWEFEHTPQQGRLAEFLETFKEENKTTLPHFIGIPQSIC